MKGSFKKSANFNRSIYSVYMIPCSPISKITRLGLSSFQRAILGLETKFNRLNETQRNLKRASEFRAALDIILNSKIDFWVLKGIELSQRNYGDPMARTFGDLDILIPSKVQVGQLRKYLLGKGWCDRYENEWIKDQPRRDWYMDLRHHISMIDPVHQISVELHWQLDYRFLKLLENRLQSVLQKETRKVVILNRELNVLSPELEFVFLLAHGTRHAWSSFKWVLDIHHFPNQSLNPEKLKFWIDQFQLQKAFNLYKNLNYYFFDATKHDNSSYKSYLFSYCMDRLEHTQPNLTVNFKNLIRLTYYDLLLSRNTKDFFIILDSAVIRASDIYEVKLPFRFLYYLYRPIGIFRRSFK